MITYEELLEHYHVIQQTFAGLRLSRWQLTKLLAAQIWRELSPLAHVVLVALALLLPLLLFSWLLRPKSLQRRGLPLAGKSWGLKMDFEKVLVDSAAKYPDRPFSIKAFGTEYAVFPSKCFDEIKRLPETQASALAYFDEVFHGAWSYLGRQSSELIKVISVELTRAIPSLVQSRQDDCAAAADSAIGHCADWKSLPLYSTIQELVASTNASAFVGRELGTNRRWIWHVERLPMAAAGPIVLLGYVPTLLRPILKPFLFIPNVWFRRTMKKMLRPIIEADIKEYRESSDKKALLGPREQNKVQLTGWLLSRYKDPKQATPDKIMDEFLAAIFESTPSTAGTLFYIMAELAANPQLADILREEINSIAPDRKLPKTHLNEFRKMDSVMRESVRMNVFSHLVLYRKLLTPLTLSVGPTLPAGTKICVDAHHINSSPALWPRPQEFDGLRHYKARQEPGKDRFYKFANLGSDAPGWGDGLQACPGRMFADNTLKVVLVHLLLNYDFKLENGKGKPKRGYMPNGSMFPDMGARILFRSRKV